MTEREYVVTWSINLDAESPLDAARQALGIHRDPGSTAVVFRVSDATDPDDEGELIDLEFHEGA